MSSQWNKTKWLFINIKLQKLIKYYCIASKTLQQIKLATTSSTGSKHSCYIQAEVVRGDISILYRYLRYWVISLQYRIDLKNQISPITKQKLRSHMLCTWFAHVQAPFCGVFWGPLFVELFTEDLSSFFEIKQRLKCKPIL